MMIRSKDLAVSLLVVGTAAAAGYALRAGWSRSSSARSKADIGARIVDEIPDGATVIDATALSEIPGTRRALVRAIKNDAREEWEHVTLERDGAWSVVDAIRRSLPYYDGTQTEYNGVYVKYDDRVVVLDAIGWARLEEPA